MKAKSGRLVESEVRHGRQCGNHNERDPDKRRRREGAKKERVEGEREIREKARRETEKKGEEK